MASRRRTTIYDVTSLKVHPDGRRVNSNGRSLQSRHWGLKATQDSRGNWIAADAGGPLEVPRFRKRKTRSHREGDEDEDYGMDLQVRDQGDEDEDEDEDEELNDAKPTRKGKERARDKRPLKRKKFKEDDSFIRSRSADSNGTSSSRAQLPSSDLLKSIHHFAAHHYKDNGFLFNGSKDYRLKRKKLREKLRKAKAAEEGSTSKPPSRETSDDEGEQESENDAEPERAAFQVVDQSSGSFKGPGRPKRAPQYRDMYKVFDGSALMAMGILVQELVRESIRPSRPGQGGVTTATAPAQELDSAADDDRSHVQTRNDSSEKTLLDGDALSTVVASHTSTLDPSDGAEWQNNSDGDHASSTLVDLPRKTPALGRP